MEIIQITEHREKPYSDLTTGRDIDESNTVSIYKPDQLYINVIFISYLIPESTPPLPAALLTITIKGSTSESYITINIITFQAERPYYSPRSIRSDYR